MQRRSLRTACSMSENLRFFLLALRASCRAFTARFYKAAMRMCVQVESSGCSFLSSQTKIIF